MAYTGEDRVDKFFAHHGIKGQKWGTRRFQNLDGTLTPEGRKRYSPAANAGRDRFAKYASEFKGRRSRYQTSEGFLTKEGYKKYSSVLKDPSLKKVLDDDYMPHSIKKMTDKIQKSKDLNELDKVMYSLYDADWKEIISGDTKTRELYNKADSLLKNQSLGEEKKEAASFIRNRLEERWGTTFINDVLAYAYDEKRKELKR